MTYMEEKIAIWEGNSRAEEKKNRQIDRQIIKEPDRLKGGKREGTLGRDWGKEGDHNGDITILLSQDAKMQTRQAAGKKEQKQKGTEEQKQRERQEDKQI